MEPRPSQYDNAGVDRQTYERPNCGKTAPHDPHFHSPIGGMVLNCPGKAAVPPAQIDGEKWRRLYDEIGEKMGMLSSTANDMTTPDAVTLRLSAQVEVLADVREGMRAIDSTLPLEEVDEP